MFSLRIYLNAAKSEKARSYRRKNRLTPVALATGWKQTRRGALHSAPAEKVNTAQLQQVSLQKQAHVAQPAPRKKFFFLFFLFPPGKWLQTSHAGASIAVGNEAVQVWKLASPHLQLQSHGGSVFGTGSAQSCHQEEGKKALRMCRADVSNDACSRNQMQSAAACWK